MSKLIINEDKLKARDAEQQEKEREKKQKKQKKERKQREKEQKKKRFNEITNSLAAFGRVVDRLRSIEDMNLRCYMLLDKVLLATDVGLTIIVSDDINGDEINNETRDLIMDNVGKLQIEIETIMDWLMSEKTIQIETTNPIPESDALFDRRRRN